MESAGLILFNGRTGYDFLALELYQGFLYYIYDMGGGTQRIRVNTPNALNDNAWHLISLLRPQIEKQLIRVDDFPPTVENMKDYSARRFDLIGPLYLGGVIRTLYNSLPTQVVSKHGFLGCMASLVLNGFDYNIMKDATNKEYAIVEGCSSKPIYHYMSLFMLYIFIYYTPPQVTFLKTMHTWTFFLFIWFYSLRPSQQFFQLCLDGSFWVEPVLSKDKCVWLKDTTQWCRCWTLCSLVLSADSLCKQFGPRSGPKVIKHFSCSTQLSTNFILLINVKMPTIVGILTFISMINTTSERHKVRNFLIFRYFSFYE